MTREYRLYSFSDLRIVGVEEFIAADDAAALQEARVMRPDWERELWSGGRLVATLPARDGNRSVG